MLTAAEVTTGYVELTVGNLTTLGNGSVDVSATQSDDVGNTSVAATASFTLDTIAPTKPNAPVEQGSSKLADSFLNTSESATSTTFRVALGSSGALAGDSVELLLGGASFATPKTVTLVAGDITNGYVEFTVLGSDLGANGSKSLTARVADEAGNVGPAGAARTFSFDTIAPAAPTLALGLGVTNGATQAEATQASGVVTVTGEAGAAIVVTFARGASTVTNTLTSTGAGQDVTLSAADIAALGDGTVSVSATQSDAAGNTIAAATTSFPLDTIAPASPFITCVVDDVASLIGTVAQNGRTNDNTLRIVGTAEPGATVSVRNGAALIGSAVADGSGNWAFTSSRLADGDHSLTAFATDVAGHANPFSRPGYGFTVDTSVPDTAVITTVTDNVGSITGNVPNGSRTDDTTFRIAGTAEPGSLVTVRSGNAILRRVFANETGNWAVVTDPLAVRLHNLNAFARDAAGNKGPASANRTIRIDQTAPSIVSLGSTTTAGSYGQAAEIRLFARTSERMRAGSAIDVTLNTGAVVRLSTATERSELNGVYRVVPGALAAPLSIVSVANVSPIASDIAGNPVAGLPAVPVVLSGINVDASILAAAIGFATDPALAPAVAAAVTSIPIVFSTEVTGVSLADFQLFYNDRESVSLRGSTITGSGRNYTLTIPATLTNRIGSYRLAIGPSTGIRAVDGGATLTSALNLHWTRV